MPLNITADQRAAQVAGQIINQVNNVMLQLKKLRSEGLPAINTPQQSVPAVTPEQIATALGPDIVAKLDAAGEALG